MSERENKQDRLNNASTEIESNIKITDISNQFPGAIYQFKVDKEGNSLMLYLSQGAEKLFNLSIGELLKPEAFLKNIHPDDKENFLKTIEISKENLSQWEHEYRHIDPKDKSIRWIKGVSTPQKHSDGSIIWNGVLTDITDKKQSELELRKSNNFFEQLYLQSTISTQILDAEGWCLRINPKLTELFGVQPKDIEGRKYNILQDGEIISTGVIHKLKQVFDLHETVSWEVNFDIGHASETTGVKVSEPQKKWFLNKAYPILDEDNKLEYVIVQHEDISKRKNAEEELKRTKILLEAAFEQSPVPMMLISAPDGKILYINTASREFLGILDEPNPTGLTIEDFTFSWKDFDKHGNKLTTDKIPITLALKGVKTKSLELMVERKDGKKRWHMISGTPIYNEFGEIIAAYAIFPEITKQKEFEHQLLISKEKAEKADMLKSRFLANMSHEIRTPLNGLMGFAELMASKEELSRTQRQHYASVILKSGNNLLRIVNDILDISSLENKSLEVIAMPFDLNHLLINLYNIYQLKITDENKDINFLLKKGTGEITINSDESRISQILTNLLDNAIKFTTSGTIEFGVNKIGKNKITLFVKDSGIGIQKENQDIIFKRFRQVDSSRQRVYGGNGLGLSIVKELLNLLEGEITLESELNKGTCFYIHLPYNMDGDFSENNETSMSTVSVPEKNLRILVVEDNQINELYITELLKKLNAETLVARDGKSCIEMAQKHEFDVILMDIRLPDMTGNEASMEIRKFNKHVPIIAQTAYAMQSDKNEAFESGINDFITKPIKKEILYEKLSALSRNNSISS